MYKGITETTSPISSELESGNSHPLVTMPSHDLGEVPENDVEDSPQTLDEILRQIEPSQQVQEMIQESQRNQIVEEVQERQTVFSQTQSDSIDMSKDKVDTIRSAMAGFQLPSSAIPSWASNMSDSEWQKIVSDKLNKK